MIKPPAQSHSRLIGVPTPGFILILVDQSSSMSESSGVSHPGRATPSKADMAASCVNRVIDDLQKSCQSGDKIKDRCVVGVITYSGDGVGPIIGGPISKVATSFTSTEADPEWTGQPGQHPRQLPVWIEARASGGTPMDVAFNDAYALASGWLADHMDSFPPVVMNITDGEPNDLQNGGDGAQTEEAARRLMSLGSDDGDLLLFNAHISGLGGPEICLPASTSGFGDRYAEFLFRISSPIPESMMVKARRVGLFPDPGARGFVFNARRESLVKLLTFGSSPVLR